MQWANKKINSKYGEHGFTAANKTHVQLLWKGNYLIQITTCLWFSYIYLTFYFTLQIAKSAPKTKNHTISLIRATAKSLVAQWHCLVSFISRTRVQNWKPLLHLLYQLNCQPKKNNKVEQATQPICWSQREFTTLYQVRHIEWFSSSKIHFRTLIIIPIVVGCRSPDQVSRMVPF